MHRIAFYAALAAALPFLAPAPAPDAGRGATAGAYAAEPDSVVIAEPRYAAYAGTTLRLSAAVWRAGDTVSATAAPVAWQSDRVRVAWVADDGVVTLLEPGEVTVTARAGLARATRRIVVRPNPAARVALALDASGAATGGGVRLVATASDASGRPIPDARVHLALSARGLPLARSGSITEDGRFFADHPGVYTVIAAVGGVSDQLTLMVAPPAGAPSPHVTQHAARVRGIDIADVPYQRYAGTSFWLDARVRADGAGGDVPVRWTSSNSDVALVDAHGVVAFRSPGRVAISAEAGGRRAVRHYNVRELPAIRMALTVNARDIRVGDAVRLREEVWGPGGTPIRDARVSYAVLTHGPDRTRAAATVSDDRVFVAEQPGVYTIIAELAGRAEQTTVVVRPGDVARSGHRR